MVSFSINPRTVTETPILSKKLAKTELGLEHIGDIWINGINVYENTLRKRIDEGYYEIDVTIRQRDSKSRGNAEPRPLFGVNRVDEYAEAIERKTIAKKLEHEVPILTEEERLKGYNGALEDDISPYDEAGIERINDMSEYLSELDNYKKWRRTVLVKDRVDINILLGVCLSCPDDFFATEKFRLLVEKHKTAEMLKVLITNPQFRCDLAELKAEGGY